MFYSEAAQTVLNIEQRLKGINVLNYGSKYDFKVLARLTCFRHCCTGNKQGQTPNGSLFTCYSRVTLPPRLILVGDVSVKSVLLIIAPGLVLLLRRRRLVSLKSVLLCRNLRSQTREAPSKGITSAVDQVELCKS